MDTCSSDGNRAAVIVGDNPRNRVKQPPYQTNMANPQVVWSARVIVAMVELVGAWDHDAAASLAEAC